MLCKPQFRRASGHSAMARLARGQRSMQYTPLDVARLYGLPLVALGGNLDGSGQTIGIISLGGGFSQSDLSTFLSRLGLADNRVQVVPVGGSLNQPDPGGADVENMLDSCIIAAIANRATIRFYSASNTSADFAAAVAQAVNECDVVSISWGAPESQWWPSDRALMDQALQQAVNAGKSVYVAAGDNGSSDGTNSTVTDYPASSPYAIGCGGTNLQPDGSETVWDDGSQGGATGGGFSKYYAVPSYQRSAHTHSTRGVPDVAGNADPETGWIIMTGGQLQSVGGTSAVAPMWAAIHALKNQQVGNRIGFAGLIYYANPGWFNDTISGSNGEYNAGPNWDACTGNGSPKGSALFGATVAPPAPPAPLPPSPPVPLPPSPPAPLPPSPVGWPIQQIIAVVDSVFSAVEAQVPTLPVVQGHPVLVKLLVYALKAINKIIDENLVQKASGHALTSIDLLSFKELTVYEHLSVSEKVSMTEKVFGLPPGTLIGIFIKELLPIILKNLNSEPKEFFPSASFCPSDPKDCCGMAAGMAPAALPSNLSPAQIKQIFDMMIGLAETMFASNPTAIKVLEMLKTAIDAILSKQAA